MKTRISAYINPTEDPKKIAAAIVKLFGEVEFEISEERIEAELEGLKSLGTLRNRISSDKIRTTLNRVFTRWIDDDRLSFGLNRQAAHAGHVSINLQNEDPMGPIQVVIEGDVSDVVTFLTT